MAKWKLRSCPRCGGDMFADADMYGWFVKCLQCGYAGYAEYTVEPGGSDCGEKEADRAGSMRL